MDDTPAMELTPGTRAALTELVVRGMARGDLDPALTPAAEDGLVLAKGPIVMPTPAGTALVGSWLRITDSAPERERITRTFHAFLPVNRRLRELCTAWQVRPDGTVNDHGDTSYDADVRDRLDDIHDSVTPLLARFAEDLPRTAVYQGRLEDALARLDDGDHAWFASPVNDSYHTVWMHLHQELILALGLSRAEDEALEERLVTGSGQ